MSSNPKLKMVLIAVVVFGGLALIIDRVFDMQLYAPLGASAAVLFVLATRKKGTSDSK